MSKKNKKVYMDYASSFYPNPSSIHALGVEAKKNLENARAEVAGYLLARPSEIIFTGSGTEANNLAIQGVLTRWVSEINKSNTQAVRRIPHVVTTNIEHVSVLNTCKALEKRGLVELSLVPVESNGVVDSKKIKEVLRDNTALVSVMYANNEIGTIQPLREIAKTVRHFNKTQNCKVLLHTDAVQGVGYLDLNVAKLGVDLLSISGAKIPGVGAGVGVLFKKSGIHLEPIVFGGEQEGGLRSGTENLVLINSLGKELARFLKNEKSQTKEVTRIKKERDYFIHQVQNIAKRLKVKVWINGDLKDRLPNNANFTFGNMPSDLILLELSARGVYVSEKSACQSGDESNSHVIEAIRIAQYGEVLNPESLRFSFGKATTRPDVRYALAQIEAILKKLREWYN